MKYFKFVLSFLLILFFFSISFELVFAQQAITGEVGSTELPDPLGDSHPTPQILIGTIINGILGLVGSLALVMFIYGGLVWTTAAGSAEKIQKGKDILVWATIGLIIIFSAYAIVIFVFTGLGVT